MIHWPDIAISVAASALYASNLQRIRRWLGWRPFRKPQHPVSLVDARLARRGR